MRKRLLSTLLALCLMLGLLPGTAQAADVVTSGACGGNVTWELNREGTLTISGSGSMENYSQFTGGLPWYENRAAIKNIIIETGVTSIGDWAFNGLENLSDISIADSVTTVGSYNFRDCPELTNIAIPNSVTDIKELAFFRSDISHITLSNNITRIENEVFSECRNLESIIIPDGVTDIGMRAFEGCTSLNSVVIPDTVSKIGMWAFSDCGNLSNVMIPDNVSSIDRGAFRNCYKLKDVVIPNSVRSIGSDAFYSCSAISTITIPSGVTKIENTTFANCSNLESITIPTSVTEIYRYAFGGTKLTDVYYGGSKADWEKIKIFDDDYPIWDDALGAATIHYTDPLPPLPGDGSIVSLFPISGAEDVGYDASNPPVFKIEFDREIASAYDQEFVADVDLTMDGAFSIYRASDDKLIYKPSEYAKFAFKLNMAKTVLTVTPVNNDTLLEPNTRYYITMGECFVRFADGTGSPAIEKGEWRFRTKQRPTNIITDQEGYFRFPSEIVGGDMVYSYHYDESWFLEDSYEYQHELVAMSIRGALAAYGAEGEKSTSKNIKSLMDDLKFERIVTQYPSPTMNSIGYAIGSKTIVTEDNEEFSLIMVAVRGGEYFSEWAGNFNVGTGIDHAGFRTAADTVLSGIKDYVDKYGDRFAKDKKMWIMGYSRGAATTNLVAKELDDGAIPGFAPDDIYAFCFECPQNTRDSNVSDIKYANIVNIVNPIDLVPKVAMSSWGYSRYGTTYYTPYNAGIYSFKYKKLERRMRDVYDHLVYLNTGSSSTKYIPTSLCQDIKMDLLSVELSGAFISPSYYSSHYQTTVMNLAAKHLGKGGDQIENNRAFWNAMIDNQLLIDGGLLVGLTYIVLFDLNYADGAYAHYGELCLSWLDSLKGEWEYADSKYRMIFINCPVDVEVYDANDTLVGEIINDKVIEIDDGVATIVDYNGQKIVALPNNMKYSLKLTATDSGEVTYTATEYNMDTGNTERIVSYYQVEVEEGDTLTGTAENLEEVLSASYPLHLNGTKELIPSVDQSGSGVTKYVVSISAIGNGKVFGNGKYVNGEFAKVTATADSGETFLGWYVDGTLVSTDTEYRFLVDKDVSIVAKFTQNTSTPDVPITPAPDYPSGGNAGGSSSSATYIITIPTPANGKITVTPTSAKGGDTVTLIATPDEGYELASLIVTDSNGHKLKLTNKGDGKYTFTMPDGNVTVDAVFQPIPIQEEPQTPWINPFNDVARDTWYYDAVEFVSVNGLMNGISSTLFTPDANLTRAQLAQILYNKEGKPAVSGSSAFVDVDPDTWYSDAVTWAAANGIVGGYGDGRFGPNDNITREQLAVMLWRYAGSSAATDRELHFTDTDQASGYALEAIRWAAENGVLNGYGDGRLGPQGHATRAQVAQMLKNQLER